MKRTHIASLLLTLALAASLAAPAAAWNPGNLVPRKNACTTAFTDTAGTWCDNAVRTCCEAGLLTGKTATVYGAKDPLTYAQTVVITARLLELLNGGDGVFDAPREGQAWYDPAADYLAEQLDAEREAGAYLLYDLYALDEFAAENCDRYDFVWYLAAVLPESALTPINDITTLPDTTDADILAFYNAGILTGSDDYGTFNGLEPLNRGQAAAMLSRIIDPSQRVQFTPEVFVASRYYLGLAPETPLLTVDGRTVNAETYCYYLTSSIAAMELENYFGFYETYPEHFEAYMADPNFDGDFGDYLWENHGIDVDAPIAWDTPDKGGMTPAQKVREEALQNVTELAATLNRGDEYPLTDKQKEELASYMVLMTGSLSGYSDAFLEESFTAMYHLSNLMDTFSISAKELNERLAEEGYVYGQYVTIYRGDEGYYDTDAQAREAANTVRTQMSFHKDDPEYLEYLIWKYSDDYATEPDLISTSELSLDNRRALERLDMGQVSGVLAEDDRYLVVLKLDPSEDESISQSMASVPAELTVAQWAAEAEVVLTDAYDAVSVAAVAGRYAAYNE